MTDQQKWAPLEGFEPSEGKYLFLSGGVYSPDKGCPDWGSNRDEDTYFPGDRAGSIVLTYAGGAQDEIPLIFGYTLWFAKHFADCGAPFYGEETNGAAASLLRQTLCLKGGFEAAPPYVLCLNIHGEQVNKIEINPEPSKQGGPVYTHYCFSDS